MINRVGAYLQKAKCIYAKIFGAMSAHCYHYTLHYLATTRNHHTNPLYRFKMAHRTISLIILEEGLPTDINSRRTSPINKIKRRTPCKADRKKSTNKGHQVNNRGKKAVFINRPPKQRSSSQRYAAPQLETSVLEDCEAIITELLDEVARCSSIPQG